MTKKKKALMATVFLLAGSSMLYALSVTKISSAEGSCWQQSKAKLSSSAARW